MVPMKKFFEVVKKEVRDVIPPTIFFFLAFHVIALARDLMLEQQGITPTTTVQATIGALIVAKVLLIADHLPFINKFPSKPLVYNIAWKTTLYMLASFVVRYLEALIEHWPPGGGLFAAHRALLEGLTWPHFFAVQLWLLVLLTVYTTMRELIRAIGEKQVMDMMFHQRHVQGSRRVNAVRAQRRPGG